MKESPTWICNGDDFVDCSIRIFKAAVIVCWFNKMKTEHRKEIKLKDENLNVVGLV